MTARPTRRRALHLLGAASAGALAGVAAPALAQAPARVVVLGGGFGGAAAARSLRRLNPRLQVTLVTEAATFATCPFSNLVIAGLREMAQITFGYDALRAEGVEIALGRATAIEPAALVLADGSRLGFERLIAAPGITLRHDALPGGSAAVAEALPHAWQAGPQTLLLRDQLRALPQGGTVVIAPPDNPFRCPPGPYERASLIAHALHRNNPRARILIVDAKNSFSKKRLFTEAWQALYPGMITFVPFSDHGGLRMVDAKARRLETYFETFSADVINLIPPQQAAQIVVSAGLTGEGLWAEVDGATFESRVMPGVHVIGDAAIAGDMPKSGFAASVQGKACAEAVVALLAGQAPPVTTLMNTCYSLVGPDYGISVAGVYRADPDGGRLTSLPGTGGTSLAGPQPDLRRAEAAHAQSWYANITRELFSA